MSIIAVHVLAAVFWAGSSFAIARLGGSPVSRLRIPQLTAGILAIVSGGVLWRLLHGAAMGAAESILLAGAVCGLVAFAIQAGLALSEMKSKHAGPKSEARATIGHRAAAALLGITTISMAIARFA